MTSQVLVGLCNYPLVNVYSLLLNMAIETVDFPMNAIFQFVMSDSSPKSNFHRRDVRLLYRKNVPCIPLVPSYIPTPYLLVYQTNYLFPTHSPYFPHIFPIFYPYFPHMFPICSPYIPLQKRPRYQPCGWEHRHGWFRFGGPTRRLLSGAATRGKRGTGNDEF